MNFKHWLNENDYRPNAEGFKKLLSVLTSFGVKQTSDLGVFYRNTSYQGEIFVLGDRKGQFSGTLAPKPDSEYWRIFVKVPITSLDEKSKQGISKFLFAHKDLYSGGEQKKIRDKFAPKGEFENGPEINVSQDSIATFAWYPRNPSTVFQILEHIVNEPPKFEGSIDDDGENWATDSSPTPSGSLLNV